MKRICGIACLLLLSGCSMQDPGLPESSIPSIQEMQEKYLVNTEWWRLYKDPGLNIAVETALARNTDLARAAVSVRKALYKASQLGAELAPTLSGSADASSRLSTKTGTSSRTFDASLGLGYELDLWGRLRDAASAAEWEYHATELDRDASRLALVNSTVNTYYSIAYARQALVLGREMLSFYERLNAITQEKFRAGKSDALETAETEQSVLSQKLTVISLEGTLHDAEQMMRDLLDLAPGDPLPFRDTDLLKVAIPSPDLHVPMSALGARPDVRAAEYRILGAYKDLKATREDLYPSISVGGTLGSSASSASSLGKSTFLKGLVTISLPFLDWNRVKWNVRLSEADFEDAKLAFRKTLASSLNEIDRYRKALDEAKQSFNARSGKLAAEMRIAEYRKTRYEQGADELKDWLDALKSLSSSRMDVLEARYGIISSSNAVFQAFGGEIRPR